MNSTQKASERWLILIELAARVAVTNAILLFTFSPYWRFKLFELVRHEIPWRKAREDEPGLVKGYLEAERLDLIRGRLDLDLNVDGGKQEAAAGVCLSGVLRPQSESVGAPDALQRIPHHHRYRVLVDKPLTHFAEQQGLLDGKIEDGL
ncbi:hypothetical protein NKDENANG_03361 [Candidatus Entotheonellaceae bacterium PAL068K]